MNIEVKERVLQINMGQVPKGYKKTKVGIIPEEWNLKILGSLGEFKKGKGISIEDTTETGLPAMMYGDIYVKYNTQFNKVDFRINQNIAQNSRKVNKGDLLFTGSGETAIEIGKCVSYQGEETIYIGGDIIGLTPKKDDSLFLAYQQNGYEQTKQKARFGQGHSVVHIYTHHIKSLIIALPPLSEQQKIAEILSICDKVIKLKEKLIEQKKLQKKYLMQALLDSKSPNFRQLTGFKGEWQEVNLEDISEITTGKLDANAMTENGNYKFFTCAKESYLINKYAFDTEALLVSGNGANVGYVHYYKGKFNAYQRTYVIDKFKQNIILIKYMLDKFLKARIHKEKNEGNTPYIRLDTLGKMKIKLPLAVEQKSIVDVLSAVDQEIGLLKKELEQQKLKKKALMQLLLTGKVRVNVS